MKTIEVTDEVYNELNCRKYSQLFVGGYFLKTKPRKVESDNDVIENLIEIAYSEGL